MRPTVAILAGGDFPVAPESLYELRHASLVVCCDGAAAELVRRGGEPDHIVGDMDSLPQELAIRYSSIIHKVTEQDDNDLTKAFHFALTLAPERIVILGATGRREDHTMGNIGHLVDFTREASCPVEMVTETGRFFALLGSGTFSVLPGSQVSLFAFDPTLRLHSEGLVYQTSGVVFDALWKATLNEASSNRVTLSFNHPAGVIVFIANA